MERNRQGLIAYQVLPIIQVGLAAGNFGRIPASQLGKLDNVERTKTGGYNRINFNFKQDAYMTREYGLEGVVDRNNAAMYANYFDAEVAIAKITLNKVLLAAERRVARKVFNPTKFAGASLTTAVSKNWSDPTADIIGDVRAGAAMVRANMGRYGNTLIINRKVFRWMQDNEGIIDRITASGAGSAAKPSDITTTMLAQVFDIDRVIVADSSYDTTLEGKDAVFGDIWSAAYAMICVLAMPGDGIEAPSLGRTFHWAADGSRPGGTVESYGEEAVRGDIIRVRHQTSERIIYTQCGHLLTNIS